MNHQPEKSKNTEEYARILAGAALHPANDNASNLLINNNLFTPVQAFDSEPNPDLLISSWDEAVRLDSHIDDEIDHAKRRLQQITARVEGDQDDPNHVKVTEDPARDEAYQREAQRLERLLQIRVEMERVKTSRRHGTGSQWLQPPATPVVAAAVRQQPQVH